MKTQKILFSLAMFGVCVVSIGCTGNIGEPLGGSSVRPGVGAGSSTGSGTGTGGSTTGGGGPNAICQPSTAPRIWRLSDEQYANAVSDLLPGTTVPEVVTPGRIKGEFINMAERYPVAGALASNLRTSAKTVADGAVKNLAGLLKCAAGQAEAPCVEAFVDRFVPRAFRRPLQGTERQGLLSLYSLGAQTSSADGVRLVLEAVLQSPSFLYRSELGAGATQGKTALTSYELATALSFLVLDSIPDDELWRAAQDGSLSTPAVFTQQANRLLASPRAQNNIARTFLKWLGLGAGVVTELSATAYPEYDDALRQSMFEESSRFLSKLVSQNGTYADLMSSRRTFVDGRLAAIYGVPYTAGSGFVEVTLPAERAGILTQAGVLVSKSRGHPIVIRGKFVRRDLFCQDIPSPPPTVNIQMFSGGNLTEREQATARAEHQVCGPCHRRMDPIGISFEKYDALSRYKPVGPSGAPVDSAGTIDETDVDGPIGSPLELAERIGRSNDARKCISREMLTYALGRELATADQCELERVAAEVEVLGGHLSDLLSAVVHSPVFGYRTGGP